MECTYLPGVTNASASGLVCARPSPLVANQVKKAAVGACPADACEAKNVCTENRVGPLCGMCAEGHAMTTEGCLPKKCPPEAELVKWRSVLAVCLVVLATLALYLICWKPVLPEVQGAVSTMLGSIFGGCAALCLGQQRSQKQAVPDSTLSADAANSWVYQWLYMPIEALSYLYAFVADSVGFVADFYAEINGEQFAKIYISFLQILGSYTMFRIQWPKSQRTDMVEGNLQI